MRVVPEEYYAAMLPLQQVDFVLNELQLYLDTHPFDHQATAQYNQVAQHRDLVRRQFEAHFGPLCVTTPPGDRWRWAEDPWPWQV